MPDLWMIVIVVAGIAGLLLSRKTRDTPLDWNTFRTILKSEEEVEVIDLKERGDSTDADLAKQLRCGTDSVKYFQSSRGSVKVETLDVFRRGQAGFIVTFRDGVVVDFTRIGGRRTKNPSLPPSAESALSGMLQRIRRHANTA